MKLEKQITLTSDNDLKLIYTDTEFRLQREWQNHTWQIDGDRVDFDRHEARKLYEFLKDIFIKEIF